MIWNLIDDENKKIFLCVMLLQEEKPVQIKGHLLIVLLIRLVNNLLQWDVSHSRSIER